MIIGILKEKEDTRVALTPDVCKALLKTTSIKILMESAAGGASYYDDEMFKCEGVSISDRHQVLAESDVLVTVQPLDKQEITQTKQPAIYVSMFAPYQDKSIIEMLSVGMLTTFSMDMIPRISRAQAMDVLSSMASISGYKAVIKAIDLLPKYFPMLTTAAGAVPPAKVLIVGAGVAGLQAIATAKRNGAMVEVFDTRLAAKEEVESLGAKFVMVEGAKDDKAAGGYAVEQSDDYKTQQQLLLKEKATKADVIITTAQLRGRPAPKIITKEIVENMQSGSVIIDLASSTGGNCELTVDNQTVVHNGVKIMGSSILMEEVSIHASKLFAKNVSNFLQLIIKKGVLEISFEDEIVNAACVTFEGKAHQQQK